MLDTSTTTPTAQALVRELDILIRARYPLISVATFEEARFRRLMEAVAQLERHRPKGLFLWSRTAGLRQIAGPNLGPAERAIPGTEDPVSVLEHIGDAERGLYLLADYGPYLMPDGLPDPILVRQLREEQGGAEASTKYLGLPGSKPLLGWEEARTSTAVCAVEGVFDLLTLPVGLPGRGAPRHRPAPRPERSAPHVRPRLSRARQR